MSEHAHLVPSGVKHEICFSKMMVSAGLVSAMQCSSTLGGCLYAVRFPIDNTTLGLRPLRPATTSLPCLPSARGKVWVAAENYVQTSCGRRTRSAHSPSLITSRLGGLSISGPGVSPQLYRANPVGFMVFVESHAGWRVQRMQRFVRAVCSVADVES